MANPIERLLGAMRRQGVKPTQTVGGMGRAVFGGYIQDNEASSALKGEARYKTYSDMLANTSIVAAGVRYFLNLTAKATWSFEPADHPDGERMAELAEALIVDDPRTPWHRIVRRGAMYRFYGFSVQEWTARRREDGVITLADVSPRAQRTIKRWDVDEYGEVLGMIQELPQTMREVYIPRAKTLYMVDDTLEDSPEGLGLFRHLAGPAERLRRYEQLEGLGFEHDLRGIPVGRGPFTRLAEMVQAGEISQADRVLIEQPIRDFINGHTKAANLGILLDSVTYETTDEAQRPSSTRQWDLDVIKGGSSGLPDVAEAIGRVNREIARVLGVEQLLLGDSSAGSFALSKDKTQSFFLLVDGTLREAADSVYDDLITPLWRLNGWDMDSRPYPVTEAVRFQDVEAITASLRDMATAGAVLEADDPAIGEVRDLLGLSRPPERLADLAVEAGLLAQRSLEAGVQPGAAGEGAEDEDMGEQEE
jgi:hypothetical protein